MTPPPNTILGIRRVAPAPARRGELLEATVATAPEGGVARVSLLQGDDTVLEVLVTPGPDQPGSGDIALIAFSDQGRPWAIAWTPA